jgi:hypothetical protein
MAVTEFLKSPASENPIYTKAKPKPMLTTNRAVATVTGFDKLAKSADPA